MREGKSSFENKKISNYQIKLVARGISYEYLSGCPEPTMEEITL